MGAMLDKVTAFFERAEWDTRPGDTEGSLHMGFQGSNGRWTCIAFVSEAHQQFVFLSLSPVGALDGREGPVAEFLHRANWGIHIGNFELDYSDGEVRYKTSIDVEGSELDFELIRNLVNANLFIFNRYLPGLIGVVHGGMTPAEAILQIEQPTPEGIPEA